MVINNATGESIGKRIRRLRKERELSQIDLAKAIDVSFGWISQIEQDKSNASPDTLNRIAAALKVPIRELLQDEDEHMEVVSRIKLIEVLLETEQSEEAELIISGLDNHPELSEKDHLTLAVHLAECRYQQRRFDEAFEILAPIITRLEEANYHDSYTLALIRNKIGNLYIQKQDTGNAYYNYKKALDYTSRFASFNDLAAYITYNVGLTLRRRGRSLDSIHFLEQAGEYFKETKNLRAMAHSLFVQGIAFKNTRNYEMATDCLNQSFHIYQAINHQNMCYETQLALASAITCISDPEKAISELDECADHFRAEGDKTGLVFVLSKKANVLREHKKYEQCKRILDEAKMIISEIPDKTILEIGEYHTVVAQYHFDVEQFSESVSNSLKSAEIFGILGMIEDQVNALKVAVDGYRSLGDFEMALSYQTTRFELLEEMNKERL